MQGVRIYSLNVPSMMKKVRRAVYVAYCMCHVLIRQPVVRIWSTNHLALNGGQYHNDQDMKQAGR